MQSDAPTADGRHDSDGRHESDERHNFRERSLYSTRKRVVTVGKKLGQKGLCRSKDWLGYIFGKNKVDFITIKTLYSKGPPFRALFLDATK